LGVPGGGRTESPPSETQDPERVSLFPGIIPTAPTTDPENGCIGLRGAEFSGNVFPLMAKIMVLPYCPILSHEKIRILRRRKMKNPHKKPLTILHFRFTILQNPEKREIGAFYGLLWEVLQKGGALGCMHGLRREIPES
jgi:hypothetical protein